MATNYLMGADGATLPDGIAIAHTLYGEPDATVTHAYTASGAAGVQLVPSSDGVEYVDPDAPVAQPAAARDEPRPVERAKRCIAKDDTCMGWRIKESSYCAAHAGVFTR
jgi:hypothetical protein